MEANKRELALSFVSHCNPSLPDMERLMSWWKTLFGWSTAQTPAPTEASATLITDVALSELTENEDSLYTDAARFVLSTRSLNRP